MISMWKVLLSVDVQRFLDKQDKQLSDKIRKRLEKLKTDNPFHFLEHFEGQDFYKCRIGTYRALVDVDFKNKIIKVQILDHRKKVYKRT